MKSLDLDLACTALDSQGFWLWKGYISPSEIEDILLQLSVVPVFKNEKNSKLGECISHPNLIEIESNLYRIALEARLNKLLNYYFKREAFENEFPYQLARLQYRNLIGPCEPQHIHLDSRLPGVWPCISIHCFLYLSDVSLEDGPTEVVAGSHRMDRYPTEEDRRVCIPILASRGDLLVLHSALWHGSSRKTSSRERPIVALAYNRWWMRQQFLFPYTAHLQRCKDLSEQDKNVLGFYNYPPSSCSYRISARGELPRLI